METEWESATKGRTTSAFFDNIIERLRAQWIKPDHWCTQALTGHGNFRAKLAELNIVNDGHYSCGAKDTVEHFILECTKYEAQRVALKDTVSHNKWIWLEVTRYLATEPDTYPIFAEYCRECL